MRVPWTARRSNQPILREVNPEYSLEGLMLKLKHQQFGHLMSRADSLEKTLMLGKTEGKRRGQQRIRWLEGITDSLDMNLSKPQVTVEDRGAWHAAVHGVTDSDTTEQQNDPAITLLDIYLDTTTIQKDVCTSIAPFTVAKTWGQPRCPSTDEWIQIRCIYTMDYYSAIKKNETLSFAATWMDLVIIILSEISQTEKRQTPYDITYMWNLRYDTYKLTSETETGSGT